MREMRLSQMRRGWSKPCGGRGGRLSAPSTARPAAPARNATRAPLTFVARVAGEEGEAAGFGAVGAGTAARTCAEPFLQLGVHPGGQGSVRYRLHAPPGQPVPRAPSDGRCIHVEPERRRLLGGSCMFLSARGVPHAAAGGGELAQAGRRPGEASPRLGGGAVHHGEQPGVARRQPPLRCSAPPFAR